MPLIDGSTIKDLPSVPPGDYDDAMLDDIEHNEDKQYYAMKFVVEIDGQNRSFFSNWSYKPQSLWMFKRNCLALGAPEETFDAEFDTDEVVNSLLGNKCRLVIDVQKKGDYAGRNNVKGIKAPSYVV